MTLTIENRITVKFQKFLCRNFCSNKKASYHREITDIDYGTGKYCRPDGLLICCSNIFNSLKELHSIEAKSIKLKSECISIGNRLPKAYVQARDYFGNYNWLILETNLWYSLNKTDKNKLINLCENNKTNYSNGVGLAIVPSSYVTKTRIRIIVKAKRNSGDFEKYYPKLITNCQICKK